MAFDHAVSPGMAGLREFVFDAEVGANRIEGMKLVCFSPKTSVCKFRAVVCESGVQIERRDGGDFAEEVRRVDGGFSRNDFKVAPARVALDGRQDSIVEPAGLRQLMAEIVLRATVIDIAADGRLGGTGGFITAAVLRPGRRDKSAAQEKCQKGINFPWAMS